MRYTEKACRDAANSLGLMIGGNGYTFAGPYNPKGCYAYSSGTLNNRVYYGTGGTLDQFKDLLGADPTRYRPVGYDCNYPGIQEK